MPHVLDRPMTHDHDLIAAARAEADALAGSGPSTAPHAAPAIPGYSITARIGRGGQGTVYDAIQNATGRRVALKCLQADAPARWRRIEREVRLLARLAHPHIVTVYESGHTAGWFYFAMEFVDGCTLDVHLRQANPSHSERLLLFASICDAVVAAHQRGVIHRDLKPANVLIDHTATPRVLDFGLAKLIDAPHSASASTLTRAGQFLGTMAWASPEQIGGRDEDIDTRSDVYSLGVMLYAMLTGRAPYATAPSLHEATQNILHVVPPPPSQVAPSLDDDVDTITMRCLAKDPQRRYGSVGELVADVRRYLAGDPIEAKRDSRGYVLRKTIRRHRVLLTAVAVALLLGWGFGVAMAVLHDHARRAEAIAQAEVADLQQQIERLKAQLVAPQDWRTTFDSARVLEQIPPDRGRAVLEDAWQAIDTVATRQQLLKAAFFARHHHLPHILHLGMGDPRREVQEWAILYLREVAFRDFEHDRAGYDAWALEFAAQDLPAVLQAACRDFAARFMAANAATRAALLESIDPGRTFRQHADIGQLAADLGLIHPLLDVVATRGADRPGRNAAEALSHMPLSHDTLCGAVVDILRREPDAAGAVAHILGAHGATCGTKLILDRLRAVVADGDGPGAVFTLASALADLADPAVIPELITLIESDNSYRTVYGIGYFGLGDLTGVKYDESHDGAWWRTWWNANHTRFDAPPLPPSAAVSVDAAPADRLQTAGAGDAITEQSLLAAGHPRQRYLLYGPAAAAVSTELRGLVVVLPGGDGGPGFRDFVRSIASDAAGGYLVAQLVAPQWSPDQFDHVVWPTAASPWKEAEFTTTAFIDAVVADVRARLPVDSQRIFGLGWSSGGPPLYAELVRTDSALRGAIVAMSVFKPDTLGPLQGAAGKAVYILHSPEDWIGMRFPEAARDQLAAGGAHTTLTHYSGGHGWHGDVQGHLRTGLAWLTEHAAPPTVE